jgi:hypothetical protein
MKKAFLLLAAAVLCAPAQNLVPGTGGTVTTVISSANASGSCSTPNQKQYNYLTGHTFVCSGNPGAMTWADAGGGTGASIPTTTNLIQGDGTGNGANSGIALTSGQPSATLPLTITSATTFYVCPSGLSNCAYNGDGGNVITSISDSNSIAAAQSKLTPWATIAHAAAVLANANITAPVTVQLADTSTSCYQDKEIVFNPTAAGGEKYQIFEIGWSNASGQTINYTDVYPQSYIEIKGNISTPANVNWTSAATCSGTTSAGRTAVRFPHTIAVVHGINFKYWDGNNVDNAAVQAQDHSTLFVDNLTHTGAGGSGSRLVLGTYHTLMLLGPNLNGTETGVGFIDNFSEATTHTPAGYMSSTVTNNTYAKEIWIANEGSHFTVWGPTTQSFSGTAAFTVYRAQANSAINTAQAGSGIGTVPSNFTLSAANSTLLQADTSAIFNSCHSTNNTCNLSSYAKHSGVTLGGIVFDFDNAQAASGSDTYTGVGTIMYSPFGTPSGTALAGATLKASTAVNTPLIQTATNCSSSAAPAVCAAAASGSVVVAAAATTVTVNTTAVTASSQIQLTFDSSLGTKLSVTCNTTPVQPTVSARTSGTSFTITVPSAPTTNPACFSYSIIN